MSTLLQILQKEKSSRLSGGIYHKLQIEMTYNSNHIEGSRLTHEQTRYIYETNTVGVDGEALNVDDIVETANHFRCIDMVIDRAELPLTEEFVNELHRTLKSGTTDSRLDYFAVGGYKRLPNTVGNSETAPPAEVPAKMRALINAYNAKKDKTLEDLVQFHYEFERIHPFQDGNGRVGRLLLLKGCLQCGIVPFVIDEDLKFYYYRGLREWNDERGYLLETCLAAQDKFKRWLDYFQIEY